jgi:hypothetical protein
VPHQTDPGIGNKNIHEKQGGTDQQEGGDLEYGNVDGAEKGVGQDILDQAGALHRGGKAGGHNDQQGTHQGNRQIIGKFAGQTALPLHPPDGVKALLNCAQQGKYGKQ